MISFFKHPDVPKIDKLRQAAREHPCVLCKAPAEMTVPAHCNDVEWKGIGKKSPGWMLAYVCSDCHDKIDGRAGGLNIDEKRSLWNTAWKRTVAIWFREGLVKVA